MIQPPVLKEEEAQRTHRYTSSVILEASISKEVEQEVHRLELATMEEMEVTLRRASINCFNFFRKVAEFIEDTIEKLIENGEDRRRAKLVCDLLRFLRMFLQVGSPQKREEVRMLMGKSEIIFPFLNYLEITKLNRYSVKILRLFVELVNELLSEEGNKVIQKILHQYFSNKPESYELFFKIKQVIGQVDLDKSTRMRSRSISTAMQQLRRSARSQQASDSTMLQFLILLCRGNNRKNQLFLTGLNKQSSFDVIKIVLSILRAQTNETDGIPLINLKNYQLIGQCFEAVRALVEGPCNENQELFVGSSFFEISSKYLKFSLETDHEVAAGFSLPTPMLKVVDDIAEVSPHLS